MATSISEKPGFLFAEEDVFKNNTFVLITHIFKLILKCSFKAVTKGNTCKMITSYRGKILLQFNGNEVIKLRANTNPTKQTK
jgi:hypothetical protein